ncbi:hypothetical protein AMELA_G00183380 [Ameiurus melas]|uniref:Insulin-like domain-containing protein n=1 Tax=Ameiurus melas TaxID=219545 RepID=A0A7J6AAJ6_AMEME|nr:hypothetical protein AMELA_G00183380 [Ameiurus melas]
MLQLPSRISRRSRGVRIRVILYRFLLVCTTGKPTGYGPNSRRLHNRGIVDECCFQSCELKRLEMYCAPVKSGKAPRSVREQRHTDTPKTPKKPISGHSHTSCKEVHQKNSSRGNTGGRNYRM